MKKSPPPSKAADKAEKPFFRPFEAIKKPAKNKAPAAEASKAKAPPPNGKPRAAAVAPSPPEPPKLTAEEEISFHQLMYGVAPLDKSKGGRIPTTAEKLPEPRLREMVDAAAQADEVAREALRKLVHGAEEKFEVIDDGEHLEGRRADTPGKLFRSLRRGELTIDARCDLHGLPLEDARLAVDQFLRTSRARGERVGLVIHGKGGHSPGGLAVLRGEIAAWLSQGPASACVDAFCTAVRDDGGAGALYILLRR